MHPPHDVTVFATEDGSPSLFSERFGVSYHSRFGAWRETQHVFVEAGLRYAAVDRTHVDVLDFGFGTGLNALATVLHAFGRGLSLNYVGLEAYPVGEALLRALDYPTALALSPDETALHDRLYAVPWPGEGFLNAHLRVEKRLSRFEDLADRQAFDLAYYDAFAPDAQPELWTRQMFAAVFAALRPGGILVTYCAKGQVKRDLRAVGFVVERLAGPPGKREMTRASRPAA